MVPFSALELPLKSFGSNQSEAGLCQQTKLSFNFKKNHFQLAIATMPI
jgi:hypothetical protein